MKEENNMSSDEQVWEEYLSGRPNLNRWWNYCLDRSYTIATYGKNVSDHTGIDPVRFLKMQKCRNYHRMAIMHDQVLDDDYTDNGRRILDLDDGEALAYALNLRHEASYRLMVDSKAIRNVSPLSISYEEALYLHDNKSERNNPYINVVCARNMPVDIDSIDEHGSFLNEVDNVLHYMDYWQNAGLNHTVWDTEEDLIRTVRDCRNYPGLLLLPNESSTIIDSDYLDNYLSAPKLYPTDIDSDDWHDKAVRFMSTLDGNAKDHRRMDRIGRTWPIDFLGLVFMSLSCFLTRNIDDLTFMDEVYRFCTVAVKDSNVLNMEAGSYRPGQLDPKLFDLLREYGSSFAKPLLESVLSDMNPADEEKTS